MQFDNGFSKVSEPDKSVSNALELNKDSLQIKETTVSTFGLHKSQTEKSDTVSPLRNENEMGQDYSLVNQSSEAVTSSNELKTETEQDILNIIGSNPSEVQKELFIGKSNYTESNLGPGYSEHLVFKAENATKITPFLEHAKGMKDITNDPKFEPLSGIKNTTKSDSNQAIFWNREFSSFSNSQGEYINSSLTTELQTEKNTENVTTEELDHYSEYIGDTSTTESSSMQDYSEDIQETDEYKSKNDYSNSSLTTGLQTEKNTENVTKEELDHYSEYIGDKYTTGSSLVQDYSDDVQETEEYKSEKDYSNNSLTKQLQTEKNSENVTKEELDHYSEYIGEISTTESSLVQDYSDDIQETDEYQSEKDYSNFSLTTELQTEKNTENVTKEELDHYSEYLGETSTTQSSLIQDYSDDKRETEQAES